MLTRAFADTGLVEVTRSLRGCDRVHGFVVDLGLRWLVLARLSPDLDLDGYTAVRWKHVKRARLLERDHVAVRALDQRRTAPAAVPGLDPTTTGLLLRSAATTFDSVTIHPEAHDPSICWIGPIVGFETKSIRLLPIDGDGHGAPAPIRLPFDLITRIDVGSRYQTGLTAAAAWR